MIHSTKNSRRQRILIFVLLTLVILSSLIGGYLIYLKIDENKSKLIVTSVELKAANSTQLISNDISSHYTNEETIYSTQKTLINSTAQILTNHFSLKNYSKIYLFEKSCALLALKSGCVAIGFKLTILDSHITVFDSQLKSVKHKLDCSKHIITAMIELPNEQIAFISENKYNIFLGDLEHERVNKIPDEHNKQLFSLAHLNGSKLLAGSNGQLVTWDLAISANQRKYFVEGIHNLQIKILKVLKDERYIALAGLSSKILIWDLKRERLANIFEEHVQRVHSLEQLDDYTLASGVENGKIDVWNISNGSKIYELNHIYNYYSVTALKLFKNNYLISGYENGLIAIWDLDTKSIKLELDGHDNQVCEFVGRNCYSMGFFLNNIKFFILF
jgi:WD40 repeat protein